MTVQWLLIGGDAHGMTVDIPGDAPLVRITRNGRQQVYQAHRWAIGTDLYMLGVHDADAAQLLPSIVEPLIAERRLRAAGVWDPARG